MRTTYLALILVASSACADSSDETDEIEVDPDSKADASELRVRAGDTSLWVDRAVVRRGDDLVLRGRTSRNLTGGDAFILDDGYGTFAVTSARTFELVWPVSSAGILIEGTSQFIGLGFAHSADRPDRLTARAIVRPRLATPTGSSRVWLTAELTPVVVNGLVVYRLAGHTDAATNGVYAKANNVDVPVRAVDSRRFEIDLSADQVFALTAGGDIGVTAYGNSWSAEKRARLGLALKRIGLTAGDPEVIWPGPTCTAATKACLTGLADGAVDLGGCGDAVAVYACAGTLGVFVDEASVAAKRHDADVRLATPASRNDAIGLVGADKADAFLAAAKQPIDRKLDGFRGRWYLSTTARTNALSAALESGIDLAYARPLDLVPRHPVVPGNLAATRQVVADAVLAEIAVMDFQGPLQTTLEDLVHDQRAEHVASIRAFRTTVTATTVSSIPGQDFYLSDWLSLHTEVAIDRATGQVVYTTVEID